MRFFIKAISVFILAVVLLPLNTEADNTPQGTYEPTVVLSAPWGIENFMVDKISSKPGTFAFYRDDVGLASGPTSFTVAPNGDIYIDDHMNNRVQRFSPTGKFIDVIPNARGSYYGGFVVDKEGNIYSPDMRSVNPKVYKFDQNGNQVMIYPIVKDEEMGTDKYHKWGGGLIQCDDSSRLFIGYDRGIFQIGTKDMVFSPAQQKSSLISADRGSFGATANAPNMNKPFFEADLLGADENSVYTWIQDAKNMNIRTITKKTHHGTILGVYRLDSSKIECELLTNFSMSRRMIFDKGNIYVFCSDKEGIKIIKWSPVEEGK